MILPDVNVLIYAFRPDSTHHEVCRAWLERVLRSNSRFGIAPLTLAAVIRITTNRRPFEEPSSVEQACRFCDYILDQPHCQLIEPRERHWGIFTSLIIETETRGRRVTDAWYAALAIEWGCEWITLDRDFARFPGLRWSLPGA
jgi:toxin-antitoxin system PIN domain toxin